MFTCFQGWSLVCIVGEPCIYILLLSPVLRPRSASLDYELCAPIEYAAQCYNNHNILNCMSQGKVCHFWPNPYNHTTMYMQLLSTRRYQSRRPLHNITFLQPVMDIIELSLLYVCERKVDGCSRSRNIVDFVTISYSLLMFYNVSMYEFTLARSLLHIYLNKERKRPTMHVHATYIHYISLTISNAIYYKLILIQTVCSCNIQLSNCTCSMKTHHPSLYPPL